MSRSASQRPNCGESSKSRTDNDDSTSAHVFQSLPSLNRIHVKGSVGDTNELFVDELFDAQVG
jgi:hypothetical protein